MLKVAGLILAGVATSVLLYLGWSVYGPVALNTIAPRKFYYTVDADISIDSERISMSGTTECRWVQRPVGPLVQDTSHFRMIGGPVARKLPDGSALLIWVGDLCNERRNISGVLFDQNTNVPVTAQAYLQLAKKKRWYLVHLDNAQAPNSIDVYIGPDYFREPEAEIRIEHVEIRRVEEGQPSDPTDEVPWLRARSADAPATETPFIGYFARVVSRDVWVRIPGISQALTSFKEPVTNVFRLLATKPLGGIPTILIEGGEVVPLTFDTNDLHLHSADLGRKWVFKLQRSSRPPNKDEGCYGFLTELFLPRPTRRLFVDDRLISSDFGNSPAAFDPTTGLVISPGALCLRSGQSFVSAD